MSKEQPSFTSEDLSKYQWEGTLEQVSQAKCQHYSQIFRDKSEEYKVNEDIKGEAIFSLLSRVTALWIDPTGKKDVSFIEEYLQQFSNNDLNILRELVAITKNNEIRARIADILWISRKRDKEKARPIKMAKIAVEAYLKSARTLEDCEHWMSCYDRLMRAAQLAPLIDGKKNTAMCDAIAKHIEDLINRYETEKNEFLTGSSMKILQENFGKKRLNMIWDDLSLSGSQYAEIAAKKSNYAENFQDYHKAYYQKVAYHRIESEWYKIIGDREAERNAQLSLAEVEVWYGQQALNYDEYSSYAVAAGRTKSAIKILTKIEDTFGRKEDSSKRIQELHKLILDYQQKSISQMPSIPLIEEEQLSDPEMQQTAIELVTGKSIRDALYSLAFGCKLIKNIEELETEVEENRESFPLLYLIPTAFTDKEGKTKAINRNNEDSLEQDMFQKASFYQSWYGMNFVVPACERICSEHDVKQDDLSFIVENNPFIPQGHELLYLRGLLAGLQNDPVISTHLLVPQLENSLRHILKQQGFIASNMTSEMIQDEYTLGKVLALPELNQVLTEDIIFSLKGLLVGRMGGNIRNEVCHGLYHYGQFYDAQTIYLWWLTLFLCLTPSFKHWADDNG